MKKLVSLIAAVAITLNIALFAWIGVSYVNVVTNNSNANPQFAHWNFFVVISNGRR